MRPLMGSNFQEKCIPSPLRPTDAGPTLAGMFRRPREPKGHSAPSPERLWEPPQMAGHLDLHGNGDKPRLFQVSKTPQ